jgi:hypothetical protein
MAMPNDGLPAEHPLSCLKNDIDLLLLRLRAVFGEDGRPDIALDVRSVRRA